MEISRLGQLLVKCPACNGLYDSGIVTDFDMLERAIGSERSVTTHCPFCGRKNSTSIKDMAYTSALTGVEKLRYGNDS